jgi:hypothetical protein
MHRKNTFIKIKNAVDTLVNNIDNGNVDDETVFQSCNALVQAYTLVQVQNALIQRMGKQIKLLRVNLNNCQKKIVLMKK